MKIAVLLVDDEKEFVDVLGERLEARGLTVYLAGSGDEALAELGRHHVDVVILDVQMPGKDGVSTLKEMKELHPLVEVIMLSGNATVESAIDGLKQGAFDFLLKPTEVSELVEKIALAYKRKADQENRIRNAEIQRIMLTRSWG